MRRRSPPSAALRRAACRASSGRSSCATSRPARRAGSRSPSLVDLNGDGKLEIVAPFYSTFVFDAKGQLLGKGTATKGRVYAPGVVADLDGDKIPEIVVGGNEGTVAAYDLVGGKLRLKRGWPASTCSGGQCPEVRGMAAADLDGDGRVEVVVTTTNTSSTGSQVFVFDANGRLWHPKGAPATSWPRYNQLTGAGNDADVQRRRQPRLRRLRRERRRSGTSTTTRSSRSSSRSTTTRSTSSTTTGRRCSPSPWFTNRQTGYAGRRLGWGQFIRWLEPDRRGRTTTTATSGHGRTCARRRGCSGPRRRRPSPTSTATAGTR